VEFPIKILLLEDNVYDAELTLSTLRRDGIGCQARRVDTREDFSDALDSSPYDLILSDYSLPSFDGMSALQLACAKQPLCPFVFISGTMGEDLAIESLKAGASDYVLKNRLGRLGPVVRRAVREAGERRALQEAERARDAAHARLMLLDRAKADFLGIISHELRTPLHGLLGTSELILEDLAESDYVRDLRDLYNRARRRILSLVDDALLLTEISVDATAFASVEIVLHTVIEAALDHTVPFAQERNVGLEPPDCGGLRVVGEETLLRRAIEALLETAIKFCSKGGTLTLSVQTCESGNALILDSRGLSLSESALGGFFDVFSIGQAVTPGGDLGLAPALAARILSLFGATVDIANRGGEGVRIRIVFRSLTSLLRASS
jgi:signal transduction histidine kinase